MDNLRQKVISGLRWTAGLRFASQLITWAMTIIVIRLLDPEDYGLMAMAVLFLGFLTIFSEILDIPIIQRKDITDDELKQVFGINLLFNLSLFLVAILGASLIAKIFNESRVTYIIQVQSLQLILLALASIPRAMLRREMKFSVLSVSDFVSSIVGGLVTLTLAYNKFGVWSLVWGTLSLNMCKTVLLWGMSRTIILPKIKFDKIRDIIHFSRYTALINIIWYVFYRADVFVVGKVLGKEILGIYSVAMQIASLPMEKISGILNQVALPAYSSIQNKPDQIASHFLKTIRIMARLSFPVIWGISSISPELVSTVLGQKWIMATVPLQILCLIIPFRMIHNLIASAILGIGKPEIALYNNLTALIIMTVGIIIGSKWGLFGICSAWLLVYPIVFYINFSRTARKIGISIFSVILSFIKPLLFSSAMFFVIVVSRYIINLEISDLYELLMLVGIGIIVYSALVIIFDRKYYREVFSLIK
ncbi:lipopolysaccharide biosynthesis protein [Thermodesulfobacteriota bacterium]